MIDEVRGDLQNAIAELRALAHGIFPPLLMSGGLAEALPAAAARSALPTETGGTDMVGVADRMYLCRSSELGKGAVAGFCQFTLSCFAA